MRKHKNIHLLIVICAIIFLSACGRNRVDDYTPNGYYEEDATLEVLSILIPDVTYGMHRFRTAEATLNQELYELNREFELEIVTFPWHDFDNQMARLAVMMMTGEMYDIFYLMPQHRLWHFSQSGFLADIYTLIDDCTHTNRENFFTNALDAFTIYDELYAFPLHFKFEYIAISAEMPQEFISRFYDMDTITPTEMMLMYIDLQNKYPYDFETFFVARNPLSIFSDLVFERIWGDFVNINERTSNINSNEFVALLDSIRHVHDMRGFSTGWHGRTQTPGFCPLANIRLASIQYMFNSYSTLLNPIFAYFEPTNQSFLHHIPLSNAHGELYLSMSNHYRPYVFSVVSTGNEELSWRLLRHLIAPMVVESIYRYPMRPHTISFPIKRSHLESNFLWTIYHASYWMPQRFVGMGEEDECREERIQRALDIHTAFSEAPIATIPLVPISIIEEDLGLFMDGVITAEEAALRMHNRVSLWLIE